jgi:molybdate transport system permease protein
VVPFAGNNHGETQALPLAIYASLQSPGGDETAARLSIISIILASTGLLASEWMSRRLLVLVGR